MPPRAVFSNEVLHGATKTARIKFGRVWQGSFWLLKNRILQATDLFCEIPLDLGQDVHRQYNPHSMGTYSLSTNFKPFFGVYIDLMTEAF